MKYSLIALFVAVIGASVWAFFEYFYSYAEGGAVHQTFDEELASPPATSKNFTVQPYPYRLLLQQVEMLEGSEGVEVDFEKAMIVYPSYDAAALTSMMSEGDEYAMLEFVHRLVAKGPQGNDFSSWTKEIREVMNELIILGNRSGLPMAADYYTDFLPIEVSDDVRSAILQKLSFYEFVGMRGIYFDKYPHVFLLIESYEKEHGKINLSYREKELILRKAGEIYDYFERQRIERGLGPFDNSVPEVMVENAEKIRSEYIKELGGNAF